MAKGKGAGSRQGETRREFIRKAAAAPVAAAVGGAHVLPAPIPVPQAIAAGDSRSPWYRRTFRWGQTNINEIDPVQYDIGWWREYWRRTRVQGVIINAGGIVAYYPSQFALHYRAEHLGERDLFGELTEAAHREGLVVLARMDCSRAHEDFYRARSDWFTVDADGQPYRAGDRYVTCINSPYYDEYIPQILREIVARNRPEGFADNSWSGLDRDSICHCRHCAAKFQAFSGHPLPRARDWDSIPYRQWIHWNNRRRLEVWDLFNSVTRSAGGPDCLWIGMVSGNLVSEGRRFRDLKEICSRAELILFDDQGRSDAEGFQGNGERGKRMHGLLGWEKLIPESMAMYQRNPTFRKAANPEPEARMWMLEGFAGTIQPWWHHVGAYQEDRRQFRIAESLYHWCEAHQPYLVDRKPVATVGVVWSQQNADFYGRDEAEARVIWPYRGIYQALIRARIPFIPVHADHVERDGGQLSLLILPNVGALSDGQVGSVRAFVERGGSLIATGESGLYDEWGTRRANFALADVLGIDSTGRSQGPESVSATAHSYLRLQPDAGAGVYGPRSGKEPPTSGERHPVLAGLEETNILAFGGRLEEVKPGDGTLVPMTYVPDFPIYPPEFSWMRVPRTLFPALVLRTQENDARVAYLAADLDRRFARDNLPDHGDLLANLVRWAGGTDIPLVVEGPGLIDCHLYRQAGRLVLHLVNLTSAGTWRSPVHELIPVGPLKVRVRLPEGVRPQWVRFLVAGVGRSAHVEDGWCVFDVRPIVDHEVVVVE